MLLWLLVGLLVGISLTLLLVERKGGKKSKAARLAFILPVVTDKKGNILPNYELPFDQEVYLPIQALDAAGNPVPPPPNDVFTAVSSDPGLVVSVTVMPAGGPLAGQPATLCVPAVQTDANVTVTVTDQDNLPAASQIIDIIQGVPTSLFLDVAGAVLAPNPNPPAAGAAKPKA